MRAAPRANEWPLVFFTLLTQAAAGAAVVHFGLMWALAGTYGIEHVAGPIRATALGLLIFGGILAALHLGRPGNARFALANLGSSWLSREALLGASFGATLAALVVLGGMGLAVAAAALGMLLVLAISRLYRLRTVPAWDTWATPASFVASTAILGPATVAVIVAQVGAWSGHGSRETWDSLRTLGLIAATASGAQIIFLVLHLRGLRGAPGAARQSARIVTSRLKAVLVARTILAILGVPQMLSATWPTGGPFHLWKVAAGAALLFASEILGRYLFYASHKSVGL